MRRRNVIRMLKHLTVAMLERKKTFPYNYYKIFRKVFAIFYINFTTPSLIRSLVEETLHGYHLRVQHS